MHGNDIRNGPKLGQDSCFFEEFVGAVIVFRLLFFGRYGHRVVILVADRDAGRQVFLHRHRSLERHIKRQICDAKSTHAEDSSGEISSVQDRSDRQCDRRVLRRRDIKTAVRAGTHTVVLIETSVANSVCVYTHLDPFIP